MNRVIAWAFLTIGAVLPNTGWTASPDQWQAVAKALGKEGSVQGEVYKVGLPRTDLKVSVGDVAVKPALALGSWLAFKPMGEQTMAMGDLVLTEDEVPAVTKRLEEAGIAVTAVHNHLLRATPMPIYVHVEGHGDAAKLAADLRKALEASKTPLAEAKAKADADNIDLDTAAIDRILGHKGKVNGGVEQFTIGRSAPVTEGGTEIPPSMGTAIAINLQPAGKGKAATTGDFVLTSDEVNPVVKALRDHGIEVTALHSHMLDEQPRLFFLHFWAVDDATKLSNGLRAALDKVAIKRES